MKYTKFVDELESPIRTIYISSYIPRKCGIATFTKDLTTAINNQNPHALAEIIAMDDREEGYDYPWEVKLRIKRNDPNSYMEAAHYINQSSADIINIQHEFGLFGGKDGDYILPMIDLIEKPIVTVFHTILPNPDDHKKYIMQRLIEKSVAVIALTKQSREDIINVYRCDDADKVSVIYHGVPDFTFNDSAKYKKNLKIKIDNLILMSGLLSRGKGVEYVIEAMKDITKHFQSTMFYVIGETHPGILETEGESYRDSLKELAKKNKVGSKVKFINKFMEIDELIAYFKACDFYITPHLDPQQGSSGTLSKAMAAGKVCISTPYHYAREMLDKERGILVPFKDSKSITESITKLIANETLKQGYEQRAYSMGKLMQWPKVASQYLTLFRLIKNNHHNG